MAQVFPHPTAYVRKRVLRRLVSASLAVTLGCGVLASTPAAAATFGKTTVGSLSGNGGFSVDVKRCAKYSLSQPADVSSLSLYTGGAPGFSGSQVVKAVIYATSSGVPTTRMAVSNELRVASTDAMAWRTLALPASVRLNAGTYCLGVISGASDGVAWYRYDSVAGSWFKNADLYSDGASNPFGTTYETGDQQLSIYATYTPVCTKVAQAGTSLATFISTLVAGDVACLRAGTYGARGTTTIMNRSGTSSARITLRDYPGDARPTILGKFDISGSYVTVSNMLFDGPTGNVGNTQAGSNGEGLQVHIYNATDVEVNRSEIRNNLWRAAIYVYSSPNTRIIRNYIHDNGKFSDPNEANYDHGIYFDSGSGVIANNIIKHNYAFGVHLYPSPSNVTVQQNTMYDNGRAGVIIGGTSGKPLPANNRVVNNISAENDYYGIRTWPPIGTGNVAQKNILWHNPEPVSDIAGGLSQVNNILADPLFVSATDYHLQSGSPAIDAADTPYVQSDDYDGTPRPQRAGYDIGAFELR